jgi:hypothetical protein
MMGSGTTLVEAFLLERAAMGFDIDPLAVRLAKVKTTVLEKENVRNIASMIVAEARNLCRKDREGLERDLEDRWDGKAKEFIEFWYAKETQFELLSLLRQIEAIPDLQLRAFFEVMFSGTIITKSGGVSHALDLAHTRPHKAKIVYSSDGKLLFGHDFLQSLSPRLPYVTKRLRSAIDEFERRCSKNLLSIPEPMPHRIRPRIDFADAQALPLEDESIDLIVTSPPYASNAIDYMRAHIFSLVWLGHDYHELSEKRGQYIGGESTSTFSFENLPEFTMSTVSAVSRIDKRRGLVLRRYFSEMTRVLKEMYRVLRAGRSSIVVVGNSVMHGVDTVTDKCLAEISRSVGFSRCVIGERSLDRNRRMLPAGMKIDHTSQIQQRMFKKYVVGLSKPKD